MLLAGFHYEINLMTGHAISSTAMAGWYWKINAKAGHGISSNNTGWISLGSTSHGWRWNFQKCYWLDFTGT
jgi:hypothetical protein